MEVCAGRCDERIVLEEAQASGDGVSEVCGVVDLRKPGVAILVMTNAAEVTEQHARGDEGALIGKCRAIFLDRRIEIDFVLLPELHGSDSGDGLGNGGESVEGIGGCRDGGFEVSETVAVGVDELAVLHESDGDSRGTGFLAEGFDGRVNFGANSR